MTKPNGEKNVKKSTQARHDLPGIAGGRRMEFYMLFFIAAGLSFMLAAAGGYGIYRALTDPSVTWTSPPAIGGYVFATLFVLFGPVMRRQLLLEYKVLRNEGRRAVEG